MYIERSETHDMPPALVDIWNQDQEEGNSLADFAMYVNHALRIADVPDILEGYAYHMYGKDQTIFRGSLKPEVEVVDINTLLGFVPHVLTSWDLSLYHTSNLITKVSVAMLNAQRGGIIFSHALPASALPTNMKSATDLLKYGETYQVILEAGRFSYEQELKLKAFGANIRDVLGHTIVPQGQSTVLKPRSPWSILEA